MTKLTARQIHALAMLKDQGPRSAYPGLHIGTLNALSLRKLVDAKYGIGSMAFPHTSIVWSITDAGLAALEENGK